MKNLELRSALIKSVILIGLCIFLVYAFAVADSGGITGTIGSLFSGAIFIAGLALALIVSVIVMFGIYFGIIYMYDKDVCRKTYDEFKDKVGGLKSNYSESMGLVCCSGSETEPPGPLVNEDFSLLRDNQDTLNAQFTALTGSVESIEKMCNGLSASVKGIAEELEKLGTRAATVEEELENRAPVSSLEESSQKLTADIASLEKSFQPMNDKLAEIEKTLSEMGSSDEDTGDAVQEKIDNAVSGLQADLKTLQESVANISQAPLQQESEGDAPHRILSYFTDKKDEKKFIALVEEAVAKEMTYAQAGDLLNESLSAEAAKVIAEHPSLTKDYIKVCRQKGK